MEKFNKNDLLQVFSRVNNQACVPSCTFHQNFSQNNFTKALLLHPTFSATQDVWDSFKERETR